MEALAAIEVVSEKLAELETVVKSTRTQMVKPAAVQVLARTAAQTYFASARNVLDQVKSRAGLVHEIDFVLQTLLQLATMPREKAAFLGQVAEVRPFLLEATIDLMKAREVPSLLLSEVEKAILDTLRIMLPGAAQSYEQALTDLRSRERISWRGTALELREVLRESLDHLAPDDKVTGAPGFQLEKDQKRPTQKQKARFILRARKSGSAAFAVAEASLNTIEEAVGTLLRSTYQRGSASTHGATDQKEVRNLKRYIDALLGELLEIA